MRCAQWICAAAAILTLIPVAPDRQISFGRHGHRSENNIKMDLQEVGWRGMQWIDLAQDTDRWRVFTCNSYLSPSLPTDVLASGFPTKVPWTSSAFKQCKMSHASNLLWFDHQQNTWQSSSIHSRLRPIAFTKIWCPQFGLQELDWSRFYSCNCVKTVGEAMTSEIVTEGEASK